MAGFVNASRVGLGCNNFGRRIGLEETRAVVDAALDAGVNFFDTAWVYGGSHGSSEELLGAALGDRRADVIVATKFGMNSDGSPAAQSGSSSWVRESCEESLRRLGTDVIDLFQLHIPHPDVPIADAVGAMGELVQAGLVRSIGVSNFSAAQLEKACAAGSIATLQNEWSLLRREVEQDVIAACERLGVRVVPYFPLASGLLSGKYSRGSTPPEGSRLADRDEIADDVEWDTIEALSQFAADRGVELIDVAIGWLAAQPSVLSVIAGAKTPEQVRRNAAGARWEPSSADLAEIDRIAPVSARA